MSNQDFDLAINPLLSTVFSLAILDFRLFDTSFKTIPVIKLMSRIEENSFLSRINFLALRGHKSN